MYNIYRRIIYANGFTNSSNITHIANLEYFTLHLRGFRNKKYKARKPLPLLLCSSSKPLWWIATSVDESSEPREMISLVTVSYENFDNSINAFQLIHCWEIQEIILH